MYNGVLELLEDALKPRPPSLLGNIIATRENVNCLASAVQEVRGLLALLPTRIADEIKQGKFSSASTTSANASVLHRKICQEGFHIMQREPYFSPDKAEIEKIVLPADLNAIFLKDNELKEVLKEYYYALAVLHKQDVEVADYTVSLLHSGLEKEYIMFDIMLLWLKRQRINLYLAIVRAKLHDALLMAGQDVYMKTKEILEYPDEVDKKIAEARHDYTNMFTGIADIISSIKTTSSTH